GPQPESTDDRRASSEHENHLEIPRTVPAQHEKKEENGRTEEAGNQPQQERRFLFLDRHPLILPTAHEKSPDRLLRQVFRGSAIIRPCPTNPAPAGCS